MAKRARLEIIKDILKIEPHMFEVLSDRLSFNDEGESNIFSKKYAKTYYNSDKPDNL